MRLFRVVNTGKPKEWGVPAYNGGMFSEEAAVSPAGSLLADMPPEQGFRPGAVRPAGGPDARGLRAGRFSQPGRPRVRHRLRRALGERTLRRRRRPDVRQKANMFRRARRSRRSEGQIYLHNASGARKATGSYYTKNFAVEHLFDHALEPAIADHLARLDKLDDRRAAESFFDFRVADIAMGSGHFLVAAVDRIERRISSYLAKRPLPGVMGELDRLRKAALDGIEQAGGSIDGIEIENVQLLRRQLPGGASTAWTLTTSPCSWRGCRCGYTPSCRACLCRSSTTTSSAATRWWASPPSRKSPT